jgi:4-hydroxy-tetrahydrodipicolinate synthase
MSSTMSVAAPRFGRVLTAMVTPFDDKGDLDLDGAATLARWLVAHGSDGLVVAGTTGEAPVLTDDERMNLIEAVAASVSVPVLAGTTTNDTAHSVGLTKRAREIGAAGVLAVTPYYNRPSQRGLLGHFGAIAEATDLPVVLYDIPIRTGRKIESETVLSLASSHANIVALKDAAGDVSTTAEFIRQASSGFEVYAGDDGLIIPLMSVGAVGVISVASHWVGTQMGASMEALVSGNLAEAVAMNQALLASYRFESQGDWPNPIPTKAMLRALGLPGGQCRLPMGEADAALDAAARALCVELGLING